MGFLLLLKVRQPEDVYKTFEKYIYQLEKSNKDIAKSEEIQLLDILIRFWNKTIALYMIREILAAFEFKLHLLEWESSFIKHLIASFSGKKEVLVAIEEPMEYLTFQNDTERILVLVLGKYKIFKGLTGIYAAEIYLTSDKFWVVS